MFRHFYLFILVAIYSKRNIVICVLYVSSVNKKEMKLNKRTLKRAVKLIAKWSRITWIYSIYYEAVCNTKLLCFMTIANLNG